MTNEGGTVRYHRAEYDAKGQRNSDCVWLVWFTDDPTRFRGFTAAEGEAMGLTPPEPAPLVVTCNGHSINLSDDTAASFVEQYKHAAHDSLFGKLVDLLRDARQDPQPSSDTHHGGHVEPMDDPYKRQPEQDGTTRRDEDLTERYGPWEVVYQPASLSPGECLRGLLAGHGHADELIDALARFSRGGSYLPVSVVTAVIDAAREVHG